MEKRQVFLYCISASITLVLAYFSFFVLVNQYTSLNQPDGLYVIEEPDKPHYLLKQNGHDYFFDLADPDNAPTAIRENVRYGFRIFQQTQTYLPEYAGDAITCNNCHFVGGNTLGGKNGGISLVGVSYKYPTYYEPEKRVISLAERINYCFTRSLNGRALTLDSKEMQALLDYLDWISYQVREIPEIPWLGLKKLTIDKAPDQENGKKIYAYRCAACHGNNGEGSEQAPPVWGDKSFNDKAGSDQLTLLSRFVFENMPHNNPILTEEEAIDVAGFIISKPRPKATD